MGYIKKLKNNELVGGTDKHTIYPVTSAEAVFEEVGDNEFKSQKYLNNHITNERIVDNTIENDKLKDDTIDMGKLNTQLKTIIQNAYDASWKVKEEPFSLETKYDANDVVYDPDTNSSYVSLTADNQGNPVNPEDEGYVEGKWRIVINGISAVQATEEIEETKNELIDYIQENLKDQVDDEIADAESRIAASEQYAQGVIAEAEETARSISGIVYQTVAAAPNYTDTIPVQNKAITAQIGYFTCSGGSGATITVDDTDAAAFTSVKGGQVKILMAEKSAVTSGNVKLQFGSVTATKKVLLYNGEAVSASNSWEANEVISVYFDGTNYQASNAQGGGGKAEKIKYDNSQSGLASDNVQESVDEVAEDVKFLQDSIGDVSASETPISMTWVQGTIQPVNGRETISVKGLRTNKFILVSNDLKITTQEGYYIKYIYQYNTTGMSGDTPTDYVGVIYDGYSGGTWDSTVREFLVSKDNYLGKYIKVLVGNLTDTEITVQESSNISLCYVTYGIGGETIAEKLQELDASTYVQRTIHPTLEYGKLSPSKGGLTEWSNAQGGVGTPYFSNSIRTSLFIDVSKNKSISVTTSIDCQFKVVYYYPNYTLLGDSGTESIVATSGTPTTVEIPDGARYIKIFFQKGAVSQNLYIPMFNLDIVGFFSEMYELKNIRNVDDGFQHLAVKVAKVNPSSAYGTSNTVQDELQYGIDHGILALPESYTNDGKPTRLIIYCHGAAVNYAGDGTRFDSTDLLPEYWLSEGYAIMDMDGELSSTDSQQHTYVPESIECYVAAYNWIIRNYNIYDDGILLGGRSQGGGMCFYIMQSVIPVIAACPLVPVCNWLWWWSYTPSSYKSYFATNAGFIGTQPTWSSNKKLTSSEINYLRSNFTAFRRYSPFWRMIVDLPTDAQVLIPDSYVGVLSTEEDEPEGLEELFSSLHARACCPVKFFDNDKDTTVPYKRNALLMYNMLINSAQDAEFRMFNIDNDVDTSKTAHHFEMRSDRLITYTNSRGVELDNVPVVYIEMLTFWRRYEQNM